jgi:DNA-binding transcriptional regulator YiaG
MSTIAAALKSEISRISRKELRTETATLKKAVVAQRHEIAAMKRRMEAMEKQLKATTMQTAKVSKAVAPAEDEPSSQLRFSASRFAAQRQKLGLSAADMARVLGVSALSVYKWEQGKNRPRAAQLATIAKARTLGKKEARALLEQLPAGN